MSSDWTPEELWNQAKQEAVGIGVSECDINQLTIDLELYRLKAEDPELQGFFFQFKEGELLIVRTTRSGAPLRSDGAFAPMED